MRRRLIDETPAALSPLGDMHSELLRPAALAA